MEVIRSDQLCPNSCWLHTDHLGTPRRMTNNTGVVVFRGEYDPHGNTLLEWSAIGNPNLNNNKFTGYERDNAAGLDFAQARHFSYRRGRFTQPDPAGLKGLKLNLPQSLNLYTYVVNDPINFTDPTGKWLPYPPPYTDQSRYACERIGGTFQIVGTNGVGVSQWGCVGGSNPQNQGGPSGNPQGGPGSSGQSQEQARATALTDGKNKAKDILKNNGPCRDLLKGASDALDKAVIKFDQILIQEGSNGKTNILNAMVLPGSGNIIINTEGGYLTGKATITISAGITRTEDITFGLSLDELRASILLHEIGHKLGVLEDDSNSDEKSFANSKLISDTCLGGKGIPQ